MSMSKKEPDYVAELPLEAEKTLQGYIALIEKLSVECQHKERPWETWSEGVEKLYNKLFEETYAALGMKLPEGMEIYFSGSFAKKQATKFSDLDVFVICKDVKDIEAFRPVFQSLDRLLTQVFDKTGCLAPDPYGMNPTELGMNTVDGYIDYLVRLNEGAVQATSLLTGRQVAGDRSHEGSLLEELRKRIQELKVKSTEENRFNYTLPEYYYSLAVDEHFMSHSKGQEVDIKGEMLRVLDFTMMGLREEFGLNDKHGSKLSTPETIKALEGKIPQQDLNRFQFVFEKCMEIRFALHEKHNKECDKINKKEFE